MMFSLISLTKYKTLKLFRLLAKLIIYNSSVLKIVSFFTSSKANCVFLRVLHQQQHIDHSVVLRLKDDCNLKLSDLLFGY